MNAKTRITVLIDWFTPGYRAGGPIQTIRNFVEAMAESFQISVITKNVDHSSKTPYPDVASDQWITWDSGTRLYYFSDTGLSYQALQRVIRDSQPDYIYVNSLFSLPFTIWPLWMNRHEKISKMVLAPRGMLMEGALGQKSLKKAVFLKILKSSRILKDIRWQATNQLEVERIQKYFGTEAEIHLVSNLPRQQQAPWKSIKKIKGEAKLVFHSRLASIKNIHSFLIWLREIKGKVCMDLYGPQEDEAYKAKCEELIATLPDDKQVCIKGPLSPDELQVQVAKYHFSVLPTLGENFGHSIFEGLLAGKPVIISDKTPWRDLKVKKIGWDCTLDDEQQFIQALDQALAMDQETYDTWSRAAWEFARQYKLQPVLQEKTAALFR